jgi:hypothetical protein
MAKATSTHETLAVSVLRRSSLSGWRVSDQELIAEALAAAEERGAQSRPVVHAYENPCPLCGSPEPRLHPAVQYEGEVRICSDPYHGDQSRPVKDAATGDRAAWAVKVLDAWAERIGKSCAPCPDGDGHWFIPTLASCFTAASPDACRIAAAEALVASDPTLAVPFVPASTPAGQWIRCEERMPDGGRVVLVFDVSQSVVMLAWRDRSNPVWFPAGGLVRPLAAEVTHWMPLPPAPESRGFDDSKPGVT